MSAEEISISEEGIAVVESGLSLRQAHEIKTGCSDAEPCAECREILLALEVEP